MHGIEVSESGLIQARTTYPQFEFYFADLGRDKHRGRRVRFPASGFRQELPESLEVRWDFDYVNALSRLPQNLSLALRNRLDRHFTALWDYGNIKFWSKRTLTQLLEEAGFEVKQFRGAGRVPYLWKRMIVIATTR